MAVVVQTDVSQTTSRDRTSTTRDINNDQDKWKMTEWKIVIIGTMDMIL